MIEEGENFSGPPSSEHQEATPILSRLILHSQPKSSDLIALPPTSMPSLSPHPEVAFWKGLNRVESCDPITGAGDSCFHDIPGLEIS